MSELDAAELRRNLDEYLRRPAAGESFLVTDAGRPVAALTPP
jgi:prevent-host-death family protein